MKLSIVIPAYNEADRIIKTLDETALWLKKKGIRAEILVVSDGSSDSTFELVKNLPSSEGLILRAFQYFPNRGKGYAVRYGMLKARAPLVLFMDADYSVPAEYIDEAIRQIEKGADIAIASRALKDSSVLKHQKPLRELAGKLYTLMQNLWLGFNYPDTQCGFKIFRKKASDDLFSRQRLSSVIFDPEILYLAGKRGYKVSQFPVSWTHREDSRISYDSLAKILNVFIELFKIPYLHKTGFKK